MRGAFVTGTDTGVGKTVVTAALALALRDRGLDAGVVKPVQTGEGDAAELARLTGLAEEGIAPFSFRAPLAPLVAARLEGRELALEDVATAVRTIAERHELIVVEGAGGLLVPVGPDWTVADLACELGLPLIVVARAGLGTVNHTLLAVAEARRRGLELLGVVLNGAGDESSATNPELIATFGDVPVLARLPQLEGELTSDRLRRLDLVSVLERLTKEEAHV
jgi:dethiobiotin synthetase